jgi:hypothetical protein
LAAKRNFDKLKHVSKKKLSVADERERRDNDRASKWLKAVDENKKSVKK